MTTPMHPSPRAYRALSIGLRAAAALVALAAVLAVLAAGYAAVAP